MQRFSRQRFAAIVRNTPLVSIDLIVLDGEQRVLLGLRRNEPARGTWFVPGGRIVKDESIADAFRRLTQWELGQAMSVEAAEFIGVYEHFYPTNFAGMAGFGTHYVVLAYELRLDGPLDTLPEEQHSGYRWLSPAQLLEDSGVHANSKAYFVDDFVSAGA